MTDHEITVLAREYAEECCPIEAYEKAELIDPYKEEVFERKADILATQIEFEQFLEWLLRRYCLVEKSKVEQMYKEAAEGKCESEKMRPQNTYAKNSIAMRIGVNFGCVHTLKSLFPDLGKEEE